MTATDPQLDAIPWRAAFDRAPVRSAVLDGDGTIVAANQAWMDHGKTRLVDNDLQVGDSFIANLRASAIIPADQRLTAARSLEAVLRGDARRHVALLPGGPTGERTEQVTAELIDGWSVLSVVDVTELIEARVGATASQREADWLWVVARSMDAAILIADGNGVVEWVNEAFERRSGYRAEELIGRHTSELLAERGVRFSDPNFRDRLRRGEPIHVFSEGWTRDDRWLAESHQMIPVLGRNGELQRVVAVSQDISEQANAARHVERERNLLTSVVEHLPVAVYWVDTEGVYGGCNQAYAEQYGFGTPSAVIGRSVTELHPERAEEFLASDRATLELDSPYHDYEVTRRDDTGAERTLMCRKVKLRDGDGSNHGVLGVIWDISERRRLEERLAQAGRMEAVGNLAAGVAHEINTPLQYLADNLEFLEVSVGRLLELARAVEAANAAGALPAELIEPLRGARLDFTVERIPMAFEQASEGVAAVSTIVKAMKQTVHHTDGARTPTDLNAAIESSIVLTRNQWKYHADVQLDLDPGLPPVPVFAAALKQVLLNMIVNAAHAISDRGPGRGDEPGCIMVSSRVVGDTAEVRIGDNGCGIPPEDLDRIFDLFFTTKEVGRGTGQGLSLAQSCVVHQHGGVIDVESTVGVGTTFVLRLPLCAGEAPSHDELDTIG